MNLYTYCGNNPVINIDPSGNISLKSIASSISKAFGGSSSKTVSKSNSNQSNSSVKSGSKGSNDSTNYPQWAKDAIAVYQNQWKEANAAGNEEGKSKAHEKADGVRALVEKYVSRAEWGAKPAKKEVPITGSRADYYYYSVVFHHTNGPQNDSIQRIQEEHLSGDFDDIGYHFVIGPDGTIYEGRSLDLKGEHVYRDNTGRIGISLMGNFEENDTCLNNIKNNLQGASISTPTFQQISSAKALAETLSDAYGIDEIRGHNYYNHTMCPGSRLDRLLMPLYKPVYLSN